MTGASCRIDARPAPATAGAWGITLILAVIGFLIVGGTLTSLSLYLPAIRADFGWKEDSTGGAIVALLVSMSLMNLIAGRAMARLGARTLILAGIGAVGIGWAGAAHVGSFGGLVAAMTLTGAGIGAATIVPGVTVITHVHSSHRGLALAVFIGALALASAIVPVLSEWIIAQHGWRATFTLVGASVAVLGLPLALRLDVRMENSGKVDGAGDLMAVLRNGRYWLLSLALILAQISMNGVLFAAVGCLSAQGYTASSAVTVYGAANLLGVPSLLVGGVLADRYGPKWVLIAAMLMQAGGTLALLGTGWPNRSGAIAMAVFIGLWGLAGGLPAQTGPMVLAELVDTRSFATAYGLNSAMVGVAGALAPLLTDQLYRIDGNYAWPIAAYAILVTLAAPVAWLAIANRSAHRCHI